MTQPLILMRGIVKNYPGVKALRGVDLRVDPGQVMALVGENGAGKSTLLKVLAGAATAEAGIIEIDGTAMNIRSPRDSQAAGIAVIYQELMLAEHLSISENVFAGREPTRPGRGVNFHAMHDATAKLLAELKIDARPTDQVGRLNVARRQMVEIAKALSMNARLIVMDEPTSSLTEDEVETLLDLVRRLRARGVSIVYVSHRMREIFAVADAITIMRDGALVGVRQVSEVTPGEVVKMMVGRDLVDMYGQRPAVPTTPAAPVLEVEGLNAGPRVRDVSFQVAAGEILGMAGLVGAGRTETAMAVFGMGRTTSGTVRVDGKQLRLRNPREAMAAGIAYVPEDRKREGLFLGLPIRTNITSACLGDLCRLGVVGRGRDRKLAVRMAGDLRVKAPSVETTVGTLSGGNQQKAVLARWLAMRPKVLLLDEPTRGVDVGAKAEIYRLVREIAATGVAVVMISSELPEVLGLADRVLVMCEGRLVGELDGRLADEEQVMALATGVHDSQTENSEMER
ncbi:ABC-type sugar transport system ATPase subunit [Nakamurella sp. UYEF19]|uniref:sugar ABC transporter ATP-binding protein n=1 Tax=Nakamurella sp. UYEF19 TaxID=1756392 RepID=UPI003391DEAA